MDLLQLQILILMRDETTWDKHCLIDAWLDIIYLHNSTYIYIYIYSFLFSIHNYHQWIHIELLISLLSTRNEYWYVEYLEWCKCILSLISIEDIFVHIININESTCWISLNSSEFHGSSGRCSVWLIHSPSFPEMICKEWVITQMLHV